MCTYIGEPEYVQHKLEEKRTKIVSYIEHTVTQLRSHPHYLWPAIRMCCQPLADFWLMHQLPSETHLLGQNLDDAIIRAVESFTYEGIFDRQTEVGRRNYDRAYQPFRNYGVSLRSRVHLTAAAFCARFVESAQHLESGKH